MDSGRDTYISFFLFLLFLTVQNYFHLHYTNQTTHFTPDNTLLHTRILRSHQRTVKSGSYESIRADRRVDRSGAYRRYGMQARATRSRRGSTGESILGWSEMPPFCYYRILAMERDDGGELCHTLVHCRNEQRVLNSTSDTQPSSTRLTSWTREQRLFFALFCFASIWPRLTDTAREAMRDDEFFREEAYSISPGTSRTTDPTAFFRAVLSLPLHSLRPLCPNLQISAPLHFTFPSSHPQKHFQIKTLKFACSLSA